MDGVWASIGASIWKHLEPWLEKKWIEVKPKVIEFIQNQFSEWLPKILKTILVGTAQAAGQLTVNTTDRVTDIIPGRVDDAIIDPIVTQTMDRLQDLFRLR